MYIRTIFLSFTVNHIGIFLKIQGSEFMRLSGDIIAYFKKRMFPVCRENASQMHCKDEKQSRIISNLPPFFLKPAWGAEGEALTDGFKTLGWHHWVRLLGLCSADWTRERGCGTTVSDSAQTQPTSPPVQQDAHPLFLLPTAPLPRLLLVLQKQDWGWAKTSLSLLATTDESFRPSSPSFSGPRPSWDPAPPGPGCCAAACPPRPEEEGRGWNPRGSAHSGGCLWREKGRLRKPKREGIALSRGSWEAFRRYHNRNLERGGDNEKPVEETL